jgi:UDP-glucose 4-epimerase
MKVLFIGGTGIISTACTQLAIEQEFELTLLNRGRRSAMAAGAKIINADVHDRAAISAALSGARFDAVVDCSGGELCDGTVRAGHSPYDRMV